MIEDLKSKLEGIGRGSTTATQPLMRLFPPLDRISIRRRLEIEDRAHRNGEDNLPSTEASQLDSVEQEVLGVVQQAVRTYTDDYETQMAAYRSRLQTLKSFLSDFSLINDFETAIGNIRGLITSRRNDLYEQEQQLKGLSSEILNFRESSGLMNRRPDDQSFGVAFSQLAIAAVLEALLTYSLIQESGDRFTLLSLSLVFVMMNVVMTFLLAYSFTKKINAKRGGVTHHGQRLVGVASIVIFVGMTLAVNLGFAHLRAVLSDIETLIASNPDSYMQVMQGIGRLALTQLRSNGFILPDIYSYILLVLGVGLSLFAFVQGYRFNDVYPNYVPLYRRYTSACAQYAEEVDDVQAELHELRDEGIYYAEQAFDKLKQTVREVPQINANAQGLAERYREAHSLLKIDLAVLLQEYRQENIRHRSSAPPKHFDQQPVLMIPDLRPFPEVQVGLPDDVIETVEGYRDQIFSISKGLIDDIQHLKEVMDDEYPFNVVRGSL